MITVEPLDKGYIGTSDLILNCPLLKGFHFQMLNTLLPCDQQRYNNRAVGPHTTTAPHPNSPLLLGLIL